MTKWLCLVIVAWAFAGCDDTRDDVDAGRDAGSSRADAGGRDAGSATDAGASDAGMDDAGGDDDAGSTSGGDRCEGAIDVTAGGTFTGTTVGATDDYDPSGDECPVASISGEDVAYLLRPSVPTTYEITVTPLDAEFDPMLYAVRVCGGDGCVDGTILNEEGVMEQMTIDVAADETVYVIVDGEVLVDLRYGRGPFNLSVVIL